MGVRPINLPVIDYQRRLENKAVEDKEKLAYWVYIYQYRT